MKRLGFISVTLFCVCIIFVLAALQSSVLAELVLGKMLKRSLGGLSAPKVTVERVVYSFPGTWLLFNVHADVKLAQGPLSVSVQEIQVASVLNLWRQQDAVSLSITGMSGQQASLRFAGLDSYVQLRRLQSNFLYSGWLSIQQAMYEKFTVERGRFRFEGNTQEIFLGPVAVTLETGSLSGIARAGLVSPMSYDCDVTLKQVNARTLASAIGGLFDQLEGAISGQVRITGRGNVIDHLSVSFAIPEGGYVNAAVLSMLAPYIPKSKERKRLDYLIQVGGKLAVEVFSFTIESMGLDEFGGTLGMKSRETNLVLNLSHKIKMDARLDSLVHAWQVKF